MTEPKFRTRAEAQKAGWFSRRHETSEAHRESVKAWRETHGPNARRLRAVQRLSTPGQSH